MKKLSLVLLLALTGCGTQGYVGQYYMPNNNGFEGDDYPTSFRVRKPVTERLAVEYVHVSHIATGWPFDGEEDHIDMVGFEYKIWGK